MIQSFHNITGNLKLLFPVHVLYNTLQSNLLI